MGIRKVERSVYYSEARKRHYMTKQGCAFAEANARMRVAYPSEDPEYENGFTSYPGFHFTNDPRLVKIRDYLAKRYMQKLTGDRDGSR